MPPHAGLKPSASLARACAAYMALIALGSVGLGGACTPSIDLSIAVEIPPNDALRAEVSKIRVAAYASPVLCQEVALGSVSEADLQPALLAAAEGTAPLTLPQLPRLGRKLFVASAFAADGNRLFAGCRELEDIEVDTTVSLAMQPAATLIVTRDGQGLLVHLKRQDNQPLGGRAVAFRAYGAAGLPGGGQQLCGIFADGCETTNESGDISFALPTSDMAGPLQIITFGEWINSQPLQINVYAPHREARICGRKPQACVARPTADATHADLYCLTSASDAPSNALEATLTRYQLSNSAIAETLVAGAPTYNNLHAFVALDSEKMMAVYTSGLSLAAESLTTNGDDADLFSVSLALGESVKSVKTIPACQAGDKVVVAALIEGLLSRRVVVRNQDGTTPPWAAEVTAGFEAIGSAGCIDDAAANTPTGTKLRAFLLEGTDAQLSMFVVKNDAITQVTHDFTTTTGIFFDDGTFFQSEINVTGLQLLPTHYDSSTGTLSEDPGVLIAGTPQAVTQRDIDSDGIADTLLSLPLGSGANLSILQVIRGATNAAGEPITAVSTTQPLGAASLIADDFDGDGADDMVLLAERAIGWLRASTDNQEISQGCP